MKKLLIFLVCLLLSGCVEREILDDLQIESAMAYDLVEENKIEGTTLFPKYLADQSIENVTLSATASSTREVIEQMERKSQRPLVRGSLETVIIGEHLAKKGIIDIADSLQRDASIGARIFLIISEGKAGKILEGQYGSKGNGIFISNLLNQNIERRELPETNLHLFLYNHFQKGKSGYLPILKKENENTLELVGIALFKKDKMIERIPSRDMFFFKLLVDKFAEGSHVVKLGKEKDQADKTVEASVTSLRSKHNIDIKPNSDPLNVTIKIDIKGIIKEYTGKSLTPQKIGEIEKKMESDIEEESSKMLKRFQDLGIDPVGIGQRQKHGIRGFDFKKWEKSIYPNTKFNVKANVSIIESGTVE
jgi:spore germination protein